MESRRFDGKVALVTGAATGIGEATARAFAREGAKVVLADLSEKAHVVAKSIRDSGGDARFIAVDVAEAGSVNALVDEAVSVYGRLDVAFNNAGIGGEQNPTAKVSEAGWNMTIGVNLTGVFHCMRAELTQLLKQGVGGAIVNNASILGTVGFAGAAAYVAAKHGVIGLTRTAALEYATQGIRVNAVCPGFVLTPLLEAAGITTNKDMKAAIEGMHAMKRLGTSEEIASAVLFLCSGEASFITGHPLLVDGGFVAQ